MSFLSRLFGGGKGAQPSDKGIYIHARCGNCGRVVRVRFDREHDLNAVGGGYEVHKTLVDDRCFRPFSLDVSFDGKRRLVEAQVEGGELIDEGTWRAEKALPRFPLPSRVEEEGDGEA